MERITTWAEACARLRATCSVVPIADDRAEVTVRLAQGNVRTIVLRTRTHDHVAWLEIAATIEIPPLESPIAMLTANADLAIGAFALDLDGNLRIRQNMLLEGTRADDLEDAVVAVAEISSWIERGRR